MTETDRVRQLISEGRITVEEGEQLIALLNEAAAAEEELKAAGEEIEEEARTGASGTQAEHPSAPVPPVPPIPPLPDTHTAPGLPAEATPPEPREQAESRAEASAAPKAGDSAASGPARWVRLEMFGGDLKVTVDPALSEPTVTTDIPASTSLEPTPDGFRVRWEGAELGFPHNMFGKLKSGNIDLRLPPEHGLDLAATAGDVKLKGVPALKGHLTAGKLSARGLRAIDFSTRAGEVNVELAIASGAHAIAVTAGNIEIDFSPSASVTIDASVSIGEIRSKLPGLNPVSRGIGASLHGAVGSGAASLNLAATAGNIELEHQNG